MQPNMLKNSHIHDPVAGAFDAFSGGIKGRDGYEPNLERLSDAPVVFENKSAGHKEGKKKMKQLTFNGFRV
jgi:hypothetical protein